MNFGLCCLFHKEPIKFKAYCWTGSTGIKTMLDQGEIEKAQSKVKEILNINTSMLQKAFDYCNDNNITSYRVSSDLVPYYTMIVKDSFYNSVFSEVIDDFFNEISKLNTHSLCLSLHPGQHVHIGSPKEDVAKNSVEDIKYHIRIAQALNFKEVNIHVGGLYNDKETSRERFINNFKTLLTREEQKYITLENDEYNWGFEDTLSICKELMVRMTYDIHHENCYFLKYNNTVDHFKNIEQASNLWKGLGFDYFRVHISSPKNSYTTASESRSHSDMIDINQYKNFLQKINEYYSNIHVDVEAKFKEVAIKQLQESIF